VPLPSGLLLPIDAVEDPVVVNRTEAQPQSDQQLSRRISREATHQLIDAVVET
jgi:hypothetical protein